MASYNVSLKSPPGRGPFTFRVHGQAFHRVSSLTPYGVNQPQYAQVYFVDSAEAAATIRSGRRESTPCTAELFRSIGRILDEVNPHVRSFKSMKEVMEEEARAAAATNSDPRNVSITFTIPANVDLRRYNAPTSEEIAIVYVADDGDVPSIPRGVTLHSRVGRLRDINELHPQCDPLTYPILFPRGQLGWSFNLPRNPPSTKRISLADYFTYLIMIRPGFNPLHHAGSLLQQYTVDSWLKIEKDRLNFNRNNQSQLRVDTRKGLIDHFTTDDTGPVGARIVLPSSFKGGRRYQQQSFLDSMTIVSKYGKPDLFLTMTCNPKWKEILDVLPEHQTASDRPDVVARVFMLKLHELKNDLMKKHVLGKVAAYIYVIEWQKRGLPHVHMLLTLESESKLRSATDIDSVISAVIPSSETPRLRDLVLSHMIHRPCGQHNAGAICMKDGKCKKGFPKSFASETTTHANGYPTYVRPDSGESAIVGGVEIDNSWVVPHNEFLLQKYESHINVEMIGTLQVVKYLHKYLAKGPDRTRLQITNGTGTRDEIQEHVDGRYVSPPEAIHRIFGFQLQDRSDTVYRLQVHLPDEEPVVFLPHEAAAAAARPQFDTNLTAWMSYNREYITRLANGQVRDNEPDPRDILFTDFPHFFVFGKHKWTIRQKGGGRTIGRLTTVSPRDLERFALRSLLLNVKGALSFEHLRTVDGTVYSTFREAAYARGLFNDDRMFQRCLEEAETFSMPSELRSLMCSIIAFGELTDPVATWNRFVHSLSEDFTHQNFPEETAHAMAYYDVYDRLQRLKIDFSVIVPLPQIARHLIPDVPVDVESHRRKSEQLESQMNQDQRRILADIALSMEHLLQFLIFVDGPGGSGKTFLYIALYHYLLSKGKRVSCSAWTGIAAGLLPQGRTCSSLFSLSIDNDNRSSTMKAQSKEAALLRKTDVFIIDEISMISRHTLEAIDRLLRDVCQNDLPFGGKSILVGGDFRQTLPIVKRQGHDGAKDACVKGSGIWTNFQRYRLSANMRASEDPSWASFILGIGDGTHPLNDESRFEMPPENVCGRDVVTATFGSFSSTTCKEELGNSAILAPKNVDVDRLNSKALSLFPGSVVQFLSVDTIVADDEEELRQAQSDYPEEFLHSVRPPTTPPHRLLLKVGAPLMLLKNLDVTAGLCNGTRLLFLSAGQNVLRCSYANGPRKGQQCFIPRIHNYAKDDLPFKMRRTQFPVVLAFAITINKSQGQTLSRVGIFLPDDVFAHGQLYVALSRARRQRDVVLYSARGSVFNFVDKDLLI